jgi:surface antigen
MAFSAKAGAGSPPTPNQYNTTPNSPTCSVNIVSDSSPVCGPWNLPDDPNNPEQYGQCTYWAAEKRPDLQEVLNQYGYSQYGGAFDWKVDAAKAGYRIDQTPQVGDVVAMPPGDFYTWTYTNSAGYWWTFSFTADAVVGHVAYVERVNTDGSFVTSEMYGEWTLQGDIRYVPAKAASGMYFIHQLGYKPIVPVVTVTAKSPTVVTGGGHVDKLTVKLSAALSSSLIVDYKVTGTALNGTDYHPLSGTLTFAPGKTSNVIAIMPLGDLGGAAKKTVKIKLKPAAGYSVGTANPVEVVILAPK